MKHLLLTLLLLPLFSVTLSAPSQTVYICTGQYAKVYHKTDKCKGIQSCKAEIKKVSLEEISKTRRGCRICYK